MTRQDRSGRLRSTRSGVAGCICGHLRPIWEVSRDLSDAVRFIVCQKGYAMIDYIDDYVGVGIPSVAWKSYDASQARLHH